MFAVYTLQLIGSISHFGECDLMVHTQKHNLVPRVFPLTDGKDTMVGAADAISNILGDNNFIFLGGEVK